MAAVIRLRSNLILNRILQPSIINSRAISTSKKNRDTITAENVKCKSENETVNKNWVSYGFDTRDESSDRQATHLTFFGGITLCMVFGGFVWAYIPDYQLRDWAQREAYIEIRRREKLGLPHVDKNLVDPSKFALPDEEILGDTEIII